MIAPAFERFVQCIVKNPIEFGLSGPIKREDIHINLRTPSLESTTGRVFFDIYLRRQSKPVLVAQTFSLANNYPLEEKNPYSPPFSREQLLDLAVTPTGEIREGKRIIYWAKYLPWCSLKESFKDVKFHQEVISRIKKPPWVPLNEDAEEGRQRL